MVAWLRVKFADVPLFMEHISEYDHAFMQNGIDGATMSGIDKDSLEDVGVKRPLHRSQIITKWNLDFGGRGTGAGARAPHLRHGRGVASHGGDSHVVEPIR